MAKILNKILIGVAYIYENPYISDMRKILVRLIMAFVLMYIVSKIIMLYESKEEVWLEVPFKIKVNKVTK